MVLAPTDPPRLLVFSDLDGTLLDHDSYRWAPARPALDGLKARGRAAGAGELARPPPRSRCCTASSGSARTPAIVENGGGGVSPRRRRCPAPTRLPRGCARALDASARRACGVFFRGFGDMGA